MLSTAEPPTSGPNCLDAQAALDFVHRRGDPQRAKETLAHIDHCDRCRQWIALLARSESGEVPPERLSPGQRLGSYTVRQLLGEGGTSLVYLARDESLGRDVALKVLRPEVAREPNTRARL